MTETVAPQRLSRDRRFVRFLVGDGVSQFGDRITELAIPLIAVTSLHASAPVVGFLTAAVWAPNLVSLLVGSWVDHQQHKKRLLVAADLLRCLVLLSLPIAHWFGVVTIAQLFVVALLAGLGQVLFQTAYAPFFVSLVRRDQYVEANSRLSTTRSLSFVGGPALGGGLIQWLTAPVAVLVDALSFAFSAFMVRGVKVQERPVVRDDDGSLLRRAWGGLRFVWHHPYLRASLTCVTTINFFNFVAAALVILFASRHLGLSAGVIGLALGIGATGGALGAVTASRAVKLIGVGRTVMIGVVLFSAPYAFLPLAGGPSWSRAAVLGAVEFVSGFGVMWLDVPLNALQTAVIPDALRSRVVGAFSTVNYGIRPLGAVLGGLLGAWLGVEPTLVLAGIGGALAIVWLVGSPIARTRTIEELEPATGEQGGQGRHAAR